LELRNLTALISNPLRSTRFSNPGFPCPCLLSGTEHLQQLENQKQRAPALFVPCQWKAEPRTTETREAAEARPRPRTLHSGPAAGRPQCAPRCTLCRKRWSSSARWIEKKKRMLRCTTQRQRAYSHRLWSLEAFLSWKAVSPVSRSISPAPIYLEAWLNHAIIIICH
jgi:hypothetical protein